jgi:hypothetical protein
MAVSGIAKPTQPTVRLLAVCYKNAVARQANTSAIPDTKQNCVRRLVPSASMSASSQLAMLRYGPLQKIKAFTPALTSTLIDVRNIMLSKHSSGSEAAINWTKSVRFTDPPHHKWQSKETLVPRDDIERVGSPS